MQLKSGFAILDVKKGRKKLLKVVGYPGEKRQTKVPVIITGHIVSAYGDDDGTSREFEVHVDDVETGDPVDA